MTKLEMVDTPRAWKDKIEEKQVEVLPLVDGDGKDLFPGWCTYTSEHYPAPALEEISGGVNSKTHKAGAIWRQGHLLHFGFEPSPDELNDNGRALLVNSICYITRFQEDRPVVRAPSPFYSGVRYHGRDVIKRLAKNENRDLEMYLPYYLSPDLLEQTKELDREELLEWHADIRPYLYPADEGKLSLDPLAQKLKLEASEPEFFDRVISMLGETGESAGQARELLARYVPDGPGNDASLDDWKQWHQANRDFLFFAESSGYRWLIDDLARNRGVPTSELKGADRATYVHLGETTTGKTVVAGMAFGPSNSNSNEQVTLFVRLKIAPAHYVYPMNDVAKTAIPTEIEMKLPDGLTFIGEWTCRAPVEVKTNNTLGHRNDLTLTRKVRVESNSGNEIDVQAKLIYQVCNDEICSPKQSIPLQATLRISNNAKGE